MADQRGDKPPATPPGIIAASLKDKPPANSFSIISSKAPFEQKVRERPNLLLNSLGSIKQVNLDLRPAHEEPPPVQPGITTPRVTLRTPREDDVPAVRSLRSKLSVAQTPMSGNVSCLTQPKPRTPRQDAGSEAAMGAFLGACPDDVGQVVQVAAAQVEAQVQVTAAHGGAQAAPGQGAPAQAAASQGRAQAAPAQGGAAHGEAQAEAAQGAPAQGGAQTAAARATVAQGGADAEAVGDGADSLEQQHPVKPGTTASSTAVASARNTASVTKPAVDYKKHESFPTSPRTNVDSKAALTSTRIQLLRFPSVVEDQSVHPHRAHGSLALGGRPPARAVTLGHHCPSPWETAVVADADHALLNLCLSKESAKASNPRPAHSSVHGTGPSSNSPRSITTAAPGQLHNTPRSIAKQMKSLSENIGSDQQGDGLDHGYRRRSV
eukprot:gene21054-27931_t